MNQRYFLNLGVSTSRTTLETKAWIIYLLDYYYTSYCYGLWGGRREIGLETYIRMIDLWREWKKAQRLPPPSHCLPPPPSATAVKRGPITPAWPRLAEEWDRLAESPLVESLRSLIGKTPKDERSRHTKSAQSHASKFLTARALSTYHYLILSIWPSGWHLEDSVNGLAEK